MFDIDEESDGCLSKVILNFLAMGILSSSAFNMLSLTETRRSKWRLTGKIDTAHFKLGASFCESLCVRKIFT